MNYSPVIIQGKEIPGYFVTPDGNVWTSRQRRYENGRIAGSYISEEKRKLNLNVRNKTKPHLFVSITIPNDLLVKDYDYSTNQKNAYQRKYYVHQLVMNVFKPIDVYPPDRIKPYWNDLPEPVKQWIRETAIINHIDHNPKNNCVDNLEWVTPRENTIKAVLFRM